MRAFHTAQSYLAASKPLEAATLFQRTAQRAQQAEAAWDDLERPDAAALRQLAALTEQAQVRGVAVELLLLEPAPALMRASLTAQWTIRHMLPITTNPSLAHPASGVQLLGWPAVDMLVCGSAGTHPASVSG